MPNRTEQLIEGLRHLFGTLRRQVMTEKGDWTVKGFIDVYRRIYTLSPDTKVLSRVIELMMFPILYEFATAQGYDVDLASHQNHYPDLSLTAPDGARFALDIKTTYRRDAAHVSGMTLGTFTGYFRDCIGTPNITFPYSSYASHLVLGIIYSRVPEVDERATYSIDQLADIPSVVQDFDFFVQEKYRIASDRPGSGNTRNIGSVIEEQALIEGQGPFAPLSCEIFDDYWMYYMTRDMARAAELPRPPYRNLREYLQYRGLQP